MDATSILIPAAGVIDHQSIAQARLALCQAAEELDLANFTHRCALDELARAEELLQQLQGVTQRADLAIRKAIYWLEDPVTMAVLYNTKSDAGQDCDDGGETCLT
jgi:hypothetical protein